MASSPPEILRRARTVLGAAGLDEEAVEFRDAREGDWQNGLSLCQFVITDVVTAPRIRTQCKMRIIRVLSDSSIEELQQFVRIVTDKKVS